MTLIELIWTITPAIILMLIAFPSFKLLYLMDEVSDPSMSVLAEGFKNGGPKPYILNKKVNTLSPRTSLWARPKGWNGQRINNILINNIGINISQSRKFHSRMKAGSRIGPHNQEVISVILGSLLGDLIFRGQSINRTTFFLLKKSCSTHKLCLAGGTFSTSGFTEGADASLQLENNQSNSIPLNPFLG